MRKKEAGEEDRQTERKRGGERRTETRRIWEEIRLDEIVSTRNHKLKRKGKKGAKETREGKDGREGGVGAKQGWKKEEEEKEDEWKEEEGRK